MTSFRHSSQPKQYQQGWTEFYKLKFKVTSDVLIPRPETELLVDEVIRYISDHPTVTILDLGTGSGCIAISLAKNLPVHLIATDISLKALKVAKQNAKLHGVSNQIQFIQSNLLSTFLSQNSVRPHTKMKNINVIVANLPYIPSARIPYLDPSVKDFEPKVALDGGEDGFELYRKLFKQIRKFEGAPLGWKPKLIVCEIDYTHGELAVYEALKYFPDAEVEVKTDLSYRQRILIIKF